jgi:hypothetical protein
MAPLKTKWFGIDIYFLIEGNDKSTATPATGNGGIIPDGDCTPKDYSKLIDEFKKLANEFGRDPQNRSAQRLFQAFLNQKFTIQVIYLNNVLVDINELQNKMRVNAANDGKQYRLQGEPTISTDGTTITFRFFEM